MDEPRMSTMGVLSLGTVCFLSYNACYAGRSILSAIMPEMVQETGFSSSTLGLWGSMFFFTYGIGQVINGLIGDRIRAKWMVSVGLFLSGVVIALSSCTASPIIGGLCWAACGFLLSMLWGPLAKVIAENTTAQTGRLLMTALTAASIVGTMIAYLIASVTSAQHQWKWAFYLTGILLVLTAILWFVILHIWERKKYLRTIRMSAATVKGLLPLFSLLRRHHIFPILLMTIINGIVRNAVAFWIPTYITEQFHVMPSTSSAITSVLPIFNLIGTFLGLKLLKKCKENEYETSIILFAVSMAMFLLMSLTRGRYLVLTIIALFLANAAMASACNIVFSVYCLRFRETGRVSAITGCLDAISYLFAALASPLFSAIVSGTNWNTTVFIWAILTAIGMFAAMAAYKSDKRAATQELS